MNSPQDLQQLIEAATPGRWMDRPASELGRMTIEAPGSEEHTRWLICKAASNEAVDQANFKLIAASSVLLPLLLDLWEAAHETSHSHWDQFHVYRAGEADKSILANCGFCAKLKALEEAKIQ